MKWIKLVEREADFWKNYMMLLSLRELQREFGFSMNLHLTTRSGMDFTHWTHKEALAEFGQQLKLGLLNKDVDFILKLTESHRISRRNLITASRTASQIHKQGLPPNQLLLIFQNFCKSYLAVYPAFHVSVYTGSIERNIEKWIGRTLANRNPNLELSLPSLLSRQNKIRQRILDQLQAPPHIRKKIDFIIEASRIRLSARTAFNLSHKLSQRLFNEIGRKHGITETDIKWLTVPEIIRLIKTDSYPYESVGERKKTAVLIFDHGKLKIAHGQAADKTIRKELQIKVRVPKIIKGQTVYPGKIHGLVKIVKTTKDISEMARGSILIARMTTPDILAATKKAAAIVTDEGGLTCHAAVVARELKIPCIVGTKFATRIFKDNDSVIVDAAKGVIQKA